MIRFDYESQTAWTLLQTMDRLKLRNEKIIQLEATALKHQLEVIL